MEETAPWLLVGLGNPGPKYAGHRHNVGFLVADHWLSRHGLPGASGWRDKFHAQFASASGPFGRCVVVKPQQYMNNSGKTVVAAKGFFNVPPQRVVVAHDELDFPLGRIAVKAGGGHGGHNGLRDIVDKLGSRDFVRVRVGVGRPVHGDVSNWLLSDFGPDETTRLPDLVERAERAATRVMTDGVAAAMNEFNTPPAPEPD